MNYNSVYSKIAQFKSKNTISYQKMRSIILEAGRGGPPVTIYGEKLDGTNRVFGDVTTIDGPGGEAMGGTIYWKSPYYYMIVYSPDDAGFRTVVLKNVTKIRVNSQSYLVEQ
jgi:hypothetical protein